MLQVLYDLPVLNASAKNFSVWFMSPYIRERFFFEGSIRKISHAVCNSVRNHAWHGQLRNSMTFEAWFCINFHRQWSMNLNCWNNISEDLSNWKTMCWFFIFLVEKAPSQNAVVGRSMMTRKDPLLGSTSSSKKLSRNGKSSLPSPLIFLDLAMNPISREDLHAIYIYLEISIWNSIEAFLTSFV